MKAPWTLQVASDIHRNGLGLELLDEAGEIAAEIFRCDADHTVVVRRFRATIPEDVFRDFLERARPNLVAFEDGTPLPAEFASEDAS